MLTDWTVQKALFELGKVCSTALTSYPPRVDVNFPESQCLANTHTYQIKTTTHACARTRTHTRTCNLKLAQFILHPLTHICSFQLVWWVLWSWSLEDSKGKGLPCGAFLKGWLGLILTTTRLNFFYFLFSRTWLWSVSFNREVKWF